MSEARILLADDEPAFHLLFQDMFRSKPWHFEFASDGVEAIKKLLASPFAVAILDLYMPGLNGLEVLQHIQERGLPVNVILMTGFGKREGTLQKAVAAVKTGAIDVIEKPFAKDALAATIENLIQNDDFSTNGLATQLDEYLQSRAFDPDLKLSHLSAHFRITPRYVTELFRRFLNTTFRKRLAHYRIQKAKQLIEATDLPMYDIAEQCGFKNYRRLTAAFQQVYNIPPRRYREMRALK